MNLSAVARLQPIADALSANVVHPLRPLDLWGARLPTPELIPMAMSDARAAAQSLGTLVNWVDDGWCFGRGVFGAADVQLASAGQLAGPRDAMHAATAVVGTSRSATGWGFHAAPVVRVADDAGGSALHVIDPLVARRSATSGASTGLSDGAGPGDGAGLMPIDAWARAVGRSARDVRVQHPLDNTPVADAGISMPTTARTIRMLQRELAASLD